MSVLNVVGAKPEKLTLETLDKLAFYTPRATESLSAGREISLIALLLLLGLASVFSFPLSPIQDRTLKRFNSRPIQFICLMGPSAQ